MKTKDATFVELQRLNRKYLLLIGLLFITLGIIGFRKAEGINLFLIIFSGLLLLLTIVGFFSYLETFIDRTGVYIHLRLCSFFGKSKSYLWDDIAESGIVSSIQNPVFIRKKLFSIKLIRVGPIQEGAFEIGKDGMKLIISGNIGLQLMLKNGKKILIGTNNPDELSDVLRQLGKAEIKQYG